MADIGFGEILALGIKVKKAMQKKGMRKGWTKCPKCGKKIRAILAGRKDHIHMACETKDCITLSE